MDVSQMNRFAPTAGSLAVKHFDADASGELDRRELAGHPKFEATFNRADTDDSRTLDAGEIDARIATHHAREAHREGINSAVFAAAIDKLVEGFGNATPSNGEAPAGNGSATPIRDEAISRFIFGR